MRTSLEKVLITNKREGQSVFLPNKGRITESFQDVDLTLVAINYTKHLDSALKLNAKMANKPTWRPFAKYADYYLR